MPVVASIGMSPQGGLLNVNADTLAAHLAGRLAVARLVIAGGTASMLDENGKTIPRLEELVKRRRAGAHRIGCGECQHGGEAARLRASPGARRGRGRAHRRPVIRWPSKPCSSRRRANCRRCRQREWWPDVTSVPTDTVSAQDIIARETAHVVQVYRRAPIVIARGRGVYLFDVEGTQVFSTSSLASVWPRSDARTRISRGSSPPAVIGTAALLEPFLSSLSGSARRTAGHVVGAAGVVLLQQRERGGRSVPQVCSPISGSPLVIARGPASWPSTDRSMAGRWGRCR